MVKEVDFWEAFKDKALFIDVRTPSEYREFKIPGAVSVPLFLDEEKEKVSEVYRSKGEREARLYALRLVSPKLPELVEKIKELKERTGRRAVVYCWRGGLRSQAVATICNLAGVSVSRLKGGYREFRREILKRMEELLSDKTLLVVYGPTGVGKTRILRRLKRQGYPILELEGLAGHRGSVFGGIGLRQPSQKMFDALVWRSLERLKNSPLVVVEGESKKIGRLFIPEALWKKMEEGKRVILNLPLKERVKVSLQDYGVNKFEPEVYIQALKRIEKILGGEKFKEIAGLIEDKRYEEAAKELMLSYYDKLYKLSTPKDAEFKIEAKNLEEAEERLKGLIETLRERG